MDKYDLINEIKIHPLVRGIMFPYGRYIKYRERKIYKGSIYPDKLRKYKSIHKGKRCFIIGNGPSLTGSELDLIKEEITFASNKIFNIYIHQTEENIIFEDFNKLIVFLNDSCIDNFDIFLPLKNYKDRDINFIMDQYSDQRLELGKDIKTKFAGAINLKDNAYYCHIYF